MVVAANRVTKMAISQGCHSRQVFYFIYVFIYSIGTCMQNLKKIDRYLKIRCNVSVPDCTKRSVGKNCNYTWGII